MKSKKNKYGQKEFQASKDKLEAAFPHQNLKKAFYVADFKNAESLPQSLRTVGLSAVFEVENEELNMRVYRSSGKQYPIYDVDEIRSINKTVIKQPSKKEIEDHHINQEIPDNIMKRNQLTVEFVADGKGGFKPNTQPDGTVKAFINFEDPMGAIRKKYLGK
ncbi:MAG: hypothetical protein JWN90_15 [Parcubacteria group bacterium]|nr:hypothetical protein [Parcubacteria group bacterium]